VNEIISISVWPVQVRKKGTKAARKKSHKCIFERPDNNVASHTRGRTYA